MRRTCLAFVLLFFHAACPSDDHVDDFEPDGPTGGLLLVRGVAGAERLLHHDGEREVELSGDPGAPLCNGKVYCDLPPSPTVSRILYYAFQGDRHALYLEADHENWSRSRVFSVELETGERTDVSAGIDLVHSDSGRPGWVYAAARDGAAVYLSLLAAEGMALYVARAPSAPLERLAVAPVADRDRPIASWVDVDERGVRWAVETARGGVDGAPLEFRFENWLLDRSGALRFGPDEVPEGGRACDKAWYGGGRLLLPWIAGDADRCETLVVDMDGEQRPLDKQGVRSFPRRILALSPDGRWAIEENLDDYGEHHVFDTGSGLPIAQFIGEPIAFSEEEPELLLYASRDFTQLFLLRLPGGEPNVVADGTASGVGFAAYNAPRAMFAPGGKLIVRTGAPYLELWENVGIRVIDLDTGAATDVEEPQVSETFHRGWRLTPDGRWLLFLADGGGQLDVHAVELATGRRVIVIDSPAEDERGLEVGTSFRPPGE